MLQTFDERNRDLVVGIDDRLVHRDEAGVSPFDSVVQGGDAVWEGLRLHGAGSSSSPSTWRDCGARPTHSPSR